MTPLAYTLSDSRVMLRRNLKHQLRYPSMTVMLVGIPIVLLLLFVYVFGGQLGAGLGAHEGRSAYLNYVVPGLLLITAASAVQGTSIMVAMDMTGGIIDRFRTLAIARARTSVWISTANVKQLMTEAPIGTRDRARGRYVPILDTLQSLCDRGVHVRILHATPPSGPFREELAARAGRLRRLRRHGRRRRRRGRQPSRRAGLPQRAQPDRPHRPRHRQ